MDKRARKKLERYLWDTILSKTSICNKNYLHEAD